MRALVALGRTRAPEGIPALAEALRDRDLEIRLAALRGLGRTASPQAAEEILVWLGEKGLVVPTLPLQSALIQCCAERPQLLLPYVQNAKGALREALGRVLGEVATPSLEWTYCNSSSTTLTSCVPPRPAPSLTRIPECPSRCSPNWRMTAPGLSGCAQL